MAVTSALAADDGKRDKVWRPGNNGRETNK